MKRVKISSRSRSSSGDGTSDTKLSFVEVRVLHVWSAAERRDTRHSSFRNSFSELQTDFHPADICLFLTALIYLPVRRSLYSQRRMPFETACFSSAGCSAIHHEQKHLSHNRLSLKKNHYFVFLIVSFDLRFDDRCRTNCLKNKQNQKICVCHSLCFNVSPVVCFYERQH